MKTMNQNKSEVRMIENILTGMLSKSFVNENAKIRLRNEIMMEAKAMANAKQTLDMKNILASFKGIIFSLFHFRPRFSYVSVVSLLLILSLLAGTGVYAKKSLDPTSRLYPILRPVRNFIEDIELTMIFDPAKKQEKKIEFAKKRLEELEKISRSEKKMEKDTVDLINEYNESMEEVLKDDNKKIDLPRRLEMSENHELIKLNGVDSNREENVHEPGGTDLIGEEEKNVKGQSASEGNVELFDTGISSSKEDPKVTVEGEEGNDEKIDLIDGMSENGGVKKQSKEVNANPSDDTSNTLLVPKDESKDSQSESGETNEDGNVSKSIKIEIKQNSNQ